MHQHGVRLGAVVPGRARLVVEGDAHDPVRAKCHVDRAVRVEPHDVDLAIVAVVRSAGGDDVAVRQHGGRVERLELEGEDVLGERPVSREARVEVAGRGAGRRWRQPQDCGPERRRGELQRGPPDATRLN
jgi:hypothetical protein